MANTKNLIASIFSSVVKTSLSEQNTKKTETKAAAKKQAPPKLIACENDAAKRMAVTVTDEGWLNVKPKKAKSSLLGVSIKKAKATKSIEASASSNQHKNVALTNNSFYLPKDLEKRLDPRRFQRVHRSTIVNLDQVKQVRPHTNGECFLVLDSGAEVKVSRSYRDVVARFVH